MRTETKENILKYIKDYREVRAEELARNFSLSRVMIHRHLLNLLKEKKVVKHGKAPKVFYTTIGAEYFFGGDEILKSSKGGIEYIRHLRKVVRPVFMQYGVKSAQIFGSAVRGEMTKKSDVDFLIKLGKPLGYSFFALNRNLEDTIGRKVDLVTSASMSKYILPYIQPDLTKIYER
jgi:uncharacterized protein